MKEINLEEYNKLLSFKPSIYQTTATYTNNIDTTPLTEEILLEALEKIENFKRKEEMQKLFRNFLEWVEKHKIKEIMFFDNPVKDKDWIAIFMI